MPCPINEYINPEKVIHTEANVVQTSPRQTEQSSRLRATGSDVYTRLEQKIIVQTEAKWQLWMNRNLVIPPSRQIQNVDCFITLNALVACKWLNIWPKLWNIHIFQLVLSEHLIYCMQHLFFSVWSMYLFYAHVHPLKTTPTNQQPPCLPHRWLRLPARPRLLINYYKQLISSPAG